VHDVSALGVWWGITGFSFR